jgi:hypothetical protein
LAAFARTWPEAWTKAEVSERLGPVRLYVVSVPREGYPQRVTAPPALGDEEALLEISAGSESLDLVGHERRQGPGMHLDALAKRRPVRANDRHRVARLRASGDVARARVTGDHPGRRCRSRADQAFIDEATALDACDELELTRPRQDLDQPARRPSRKSRK